MVLELMEAPETTLVEGKIIHESLFWDDGDPRHSLLNKDLEKGNKKKDTQIVDLRHDAYIIVFTGPRGSGKSLSMTGYAMKAVYLYNMRLVSNYPIEFSIQWLNGTITHHKSEPLDLYKLLCFDKEYRHCLILIDEAPDIISHMASMTWKNRLLNIFVRQLRKNMNTLVLGAQQFTLIDKSMRWQTDIIVKCKDSYRTYGASQGLERGASILVDMYDNSGQWTGDGKYIEFDQQLDFIDPDDSGQVKGAFVWGAYDTNHLQDVFESLKKVDMNLGTYKVGAPETEEESDYYERARDIIMVADGKVLSTELYDSIGEGTEAEKQKVGSWLRKSGVRNSGSGDRFKDFTNFDREKFLRLANKRR